MIQSVPPRSEIAPEHTWDPSSVFATDADWEREIAQVNQELPALAAYRGRLAEGPATLLAYLQASEQALASVGKVYVYAQMFYSVDTTDQTAVAKRDSAQNLYAAVSATLAFAEPELLEIGGATLQRWAASEPDLAIYAHYFDQIERRSPHIRSAEVEELLRQLSAPFGAASATHGVLSNTELTFAPAHSSDGGSVEIAQGNINALLVHPDRAVRRSAWESYADAHLALRNTMANCYAAGVKQNVFLARARRYDSALAAALLATDIPVEVFHNLIETYRRHLPTWHRYWRIRRRALGGGELHVYDTKAPLTGSPPVVPFAQATEWIAAGMRPLGDEYVEIMQRGLHQQRWVDIYPNQGKRAGAFSMGVPGTHPFILMSYNDDLFSLSTLAHELGHSMHSFYTRRTQPFAYAHYSLFVAEVASNFNQAMVRAYLLGQSSDRDFQIAVIEEAMSNFHRYFFIMPTLARFELAAHERVERGEALTARWLTDTMADLFAEGYGDEVLIDRERVGSTWAQFATHLYSNFYAYQYATGISAAHALATGVLAGAPGAAENYRAFLSAGSSVYPLDALKLAGVDMSTPAPVEQTFAVFAGLVDRLDQLVGG